MGFVLDIGVHIRKSVRSCYRSLLHHPVLAAFMVFLTFLHRFFPFAFSLLVTASPVLVCSVILLGTLLIFGQPDLPKTEREKKITHDFASIRTRVSADETITLERIGKFSIDKFQGKGIDELSCSRYSSDPEGSIGYMPLVDDTFHYTDSERRELDSKELENQRVIHKEKLGNSGITRDVKSIEKSASLRGDNSESSQGGGGGDDEATSSGSDRAESTSPDASIADILPILDELHPLLDLDAPLPVHISLADSGLESDRSNDGSNESDDEDTKIRRGIQQYGVVDNDGDEEEALDGKDDESKSAIKWTEDDQMNLRDLGNLELERNRCLEKVLTMRRASKIDEKNLIDLDTSENPFNVTQISITRQNPFDLAHDSYDDMGLPPIPGSAPSTYLPRRNPFDILYEPNEENPELRRDHVEQEYATVLPTNTIFYRHQSFRASRLGDAKQERQDLKWRPVFVPEQLASEGTSYSSFQGLPRDSSDSKLSSIPDTESASSRDDLDESKFNERVKEAEVISNIYQGSHLVNHRSPSSEDLDPLEKERQGEKDIQHNESEIKLGEVENGNASLSGTGGLVIPVEPVTTTYLRPEVFEDRISNRSSSSLSSEVDEKSSDLRKDGPKIFEPFKTEVQSMSGMVVDTHHKEPVYDTSPPGSAKVLSFSSISSDLQAEVSEVVTVPSSAEMCVPSIDQTLYSDLHGESIKNGTSRNEQIGASSNVHASAENERGSGECNRLFLISSQSDVHDDLPKNLNGKAAFSNSTQSVSSEDKTPAEEKSFLSSSMSKDQPSFDDHNALPEPQIVFLEAEHDIKDVNAIGVQDPNLKNLLPVSAKSTSSKVIASSNKAPGVQETTCNDTATEQVSVANEVNPSYSKDGSVGRGTNVLDSTKEIASSNTETSIQETLANVSPKKFSETNVGEQIQPSNSKDGFSRVETSMKGSTRENASSNTKNGVKEPAATPSSLKKVSGDTDPQRPTSSNSKDGSTEVRAKTNSPIQVSEANVGEPPKLSNSKDGSTDINNTEVSTNDISLSSTGSCVQESAKTPVKQVSESDVNKLPKTSKDIASANTGSGAQETATTVKQVSKSDDSKLPKPLKDELAKAATNDVLSTTRLQEIVPNLPKQVSEGNISESPKSSKSKDGTNKEESNAVSSAEEIGSNTLGTGVQKTVSTRTLTKKLSEVNVENLPKPSDSKDEHKEIETNAVNFVTEASKNTKSGVQENVTTDQKQVLEGDLSELPKTSNSKDGLLEVATSNAAGSKSVQETAPLKQVSEGNQSEAPKPSNLKGGSTDASNVAGSTQSVQGTATTLKQVLQGDVSELPKPSNSMDESTEVANAVDPTKSVQDSTSNQEVSETNVSELRKPLKVGLKEVDTNVVDSTKKLAPSNMGTGVQESNSSHTEGKVAEDSVRELPKPSSSTEETPKVGVDAVGTTMDIQSSNTESSVQISATTSEADVAAPRPNSEGHAGEALKPSISEESNTGELPKLTNPKESNAAESQKPTESKGWLWW